jgi:N6-adenosine-specific RNA methylase IME4
LNRHARQLPTIQPSVRPKSVVKAPSGEHFAKPAVVYEEIEKAHRRQNYLELFACKQRAEWTCRGWEAKRGGNPKDQTNISLQLLGQRI